MGSASKRNCVMGGQGSPQEPGAEAGPAKTYGSSMNHRAATPAATRFVFWIAFFAVLVVLGPGSVALRADAGSSFYKRGQVAEASEDYDAAYLNYQRAYAASPQNLHYRASLYRVRLSASAMHVTKGRKLMSSGDEQGALVEFLRASEIDPGNEAAQQEIAKVRNRYAQQAQAQAQASGANLPATQGQQSAIETMASPSELRPMSNEPLTLHMVEDSKVVYQAVGKAAGVNVLFDPDYIGKRIQVDLNNVSLLDALRIVGTLSNTFWRPVTSNTIFVAANTRAKRTEMEEQAVQTFYLTNAWQANDMNDVQTALRNVLPSAKVYGVASQNAIVMRATPDELLLAQKLINDLDKARPEVVVDISVLEVAKNWEQTLGIAWPQSIGVTLQSSTANTSTSTNTTATGTTTTTTPTVYDLAHLKASDFAVTIGSATANMLLTDSNTKILQNPRIRSTDAQKATLKIGQRIPIATGSFQSGVGVAAAISPMAETQFQYIDVGVNIDMTPTVHYDGDVTLKMKIDVSSQSGNVTISGVTEPIIAQKTSEQTIRLREGEASILGGILNQQEQESWTGIPGLSSIPILKYLFGSKDHTKTDDEIVFLLVPHIVRSPVLTPANLRSIDTGVGQAIELRHVSSQGAGPGSVTPIPLARPAAAASDSGIVPGQTAEAAGPAALAQLRTAAQGTASATAQAAQPPPAPPPTAHLSYSFVAPHAPVVSGSTFQVPVVIAGAVDIASVPLQIQYDPAKLSLVNVDNGDFLGRSGQAVALVHRDDGPGNITLNASLPPGTPGVNGAGVVCMLTFQAKAPGDAAISITRPGAMTSAQKPVQAQGAQITVAVK